MPDGVSCAVLLVVAAPCSEAGTVSNFARGTLSSGSSSSELPGSSSGDHSTAFRINHAEVLKAQLKT